MAGRLEGKRVLVTHANRYMGPDVVELFEAEGAHVHASSDDLRERGAAARVVQNAGPIDVLVANLAEDKMHMETVDAITDEHWHDFFDSLAHPLMELTRAVVPGMKERGGGKIVAITSAAPLRGIPKVSAYCAARGAQNAFVRAAGIEVARHNIQMNAIAQNYVENPSYYPDSMLQDTELVEKMMKVIPAKRLAKGWETAELALFLASDKSDFFVGQIFPFAGGWVTTTG